MMQQPVFSVSNQMLDRLHAQVMVLLDKFSLYRQNKGKIATEGGACILMGFSTRLYNMAYLLMLSRAERDGDMKPQDVARERAKVISALVASETEEVFREEFCMLERQLLALETQIFNLMPVEQGNDQDGIMPHQHLRQIEAAFSTHAKSLAVERR